MRQGDLSSRTSGSTAFSWQGACRSTPRIIYWRGFEEGNYIPKEVGGFPVCVPVGSQMLHAAGIAFAQKYNKTGAAVVVYVGTAGPRKATSTRR